MLFKKNLENIKISTFECKRDKLTIRGTEYRPKGEKLPIAIVSHGFMAFQSTVKQYAIALAKQGYVSYTFDFCGGSVLKKGKSDGKTTDMSVLTEMKDLETVISYTKGLTYTNENHILLAGCSQGGFVSGIVASKLKDEIKQLVLFYPALCIPDDARAGKMMFAKFDPNHIPEIIHCGPMKLGRCYVEDVIDKDPYELIKNYENDVLIVHGTKDNIVHLDYSKNAYSTYQQSSIKERIVELKIIEGGTHGFAKKHDELAIQYLCEFVEK